MNSAPIPLTAPDGRIVAYACPVCFRAGYQEAIYGRGFSPAEVATRRLDDSREQASRCCVCRTCHTAMRHDYARIECEACAQTRYARERDAEHVAGVAASEPRWRREPPTRDEFYALPDDTHGRGARLFLTRSGHDGVRMSRIICGAGSMYLLDNHGDEYPIFPEMEYDYAPGAPDGTPIEWPVTP